MVENLPRGSRYRTIEDRIRIAANEVFAIREAGGKINPNALKAEHLGLLQRIYQLPGGWARVIREAGFDPDAERAKRPWRWSDNSNGQGADKR